MDKVQFAIIGCGHVGKRHAEMIRRNDSAELIALCDSASKETLNLEGFQVPFYSDLNEMLTQHPEIEVVNVCTPNGFHAQHALTVLEHKMHVVCEKPLGLTKSECEKVIDQSMKASKHVFCVMQNRYSPPSKWLKQIIDEGKLGDIYMVQIGCYWNRDERYYKPGGWKGKADLDGGTLFTQFSHFVDIMYWLFGDIQNIRGDFKDFNHQNLTDFEDTGIVQFEFVNGGLGSINYSTSVWDKNMESSLLVLAEKGSVKLAGQYMNTVEYCHIQDYTMPKLEETKSANDYGPYKGSAANHHYVIQNVIDSLRGSGFATTNALEGMKVVDIIERIYKHKYQLKTTE